ncbi:MAG: alpha-glucosidase/alpha-galactosidase [Kiritimatiellae bacterium]|nr:alpha-glucosidase/alpha-galactosidase [Kiritimatiellia bacterium]
MRRPINVVFLGAGSGFCPRICRDILMINTADRGDIRLVDIDAERLGMMHKVLEKVLVQAGRQEGWTVTSSTDRREMLPGAHYVINSIEVSGLDCVAHDNDIPLKYGIDQCIGDTIGPGGLFKALRTVPVFLDILRDVRELCPDAQVLNYTNPMNIMCLAAGRAVPEVKLVGLCHSVQGTSHHMAREADVPYEEMEWECAGINHLAWFTSLKHNGEDLYEKVLYEKFRKEVAKGLEETAAGLASHDDSGHGVEAKYTVSDLVRKDMCVQFGAFITESSGHLSEYLPYYRKSQVGRDLLRLRYCGGSRFYATNWPNWRESADKERTRLVSGEQTLPMDRSWEYGSWIIESIEKNSPFVFHGNVMNTKDGVGPLVGNLLHDGCVEVACLVNGSGIHPTVFGNMPPQMAAICRSNQDMFDLAAKAVIEQSKEAAIHALMLDPLCAAVLTPAEIRAMTIEMFEAEKDLLPDYR